jgi:predicted phage baseplate assembly protein
VAGWCPFGERPRVGAALAIVLSGKTAPRPTLALAFALQAADGAAAPVAEGFGVDAAPAGALLKWEILDGTSFEPASVLRDETRGFTQSGIVELRLPDRWRPGLPEGIDRTDRIFWLRVRLIHGTFAVPPLVRALHLNTVEANAVRTLRDEVLEYVPSSDRRRLRLSQVPVLPGTLDLVVLESSVDGDVEVPWHAVDTLATQGPDDRAYVLDTALGELSFGDGVHGTRLPRGFRNVIARRYQVGGGLAGRVAVDSDFTLVQSVPFLTGASNPLPASGGRNVESREDTLSRGPAEIRARGRAVTLADYELLATQTPGADVERAHAISGRDVRFPGAVMPGTVSVLVVSSDRGADPPLPDAGTLETLAERLIAEVAPAGIQVVAAAPRFQRVAVRGTVILRAGADAGATIEAALQNLQDYLHPLRGGAGTKGWPFGGTIRYQALVRMLLDRSPGLLAVPTLNIVLDGVLRGSCQDCPIAADALIWPGGHELVPADAVSAP